MTDIKLIDLAARRSEEQGKEREEFLEDVQNFCDTLLKAVKEDRLEQFVFQFEMKKSEEETSLETDDDEMATSIMFYNKNHDIDQALGYAERLKQRIFFLSEGMFG